MHRTCLPLEQDFADAFGVGIHNAELIIRQNLADEFSPAPCGSTLMNGKPISMIPYASAGRSQTWRRTA